MEQIRYLEVEIKAADDGKRESVGIVSSDAPDRENDIVDAETFFAAMKVFIPRSGVVVLQHDWEAGSVGRVLETWQDTIETLGRTVTRTWGRIVYGKDYDLSIFGRPYGVNNVWEQVRQGMLRTHSCAFRARRAETGTVARGQESFTRLLVSDIMEVSVVTVPANPDAVIASAKALGIELDAEQRARVLEAARHGDPDRILQSSILAGFADVELRLGRLGSW